MLWEVQKQRTTWCLRLSSDSSAINLGHRDTNPEKPCMCHFPVWVQVAKLHLPSLPPPTTHTHTGWWMKSPNTLHIDYFLLLPLVFIVLLCTWTSGEDFGAIYHRLDFTGTRKTKTGVSLHIEGTHHLLELSSCCCTSLWFCPTSLLGLRPCRTLALELPPPRPWLWGQACLELSHFCFLNSISKPKV